MGDENSAGNGVDSSARKIQAAISCWALCSNFSGRAVEALAARHLSLAPSPLFSHNHILTRIDVNLRSEGNL
jgi:hypothetical protein